MLQTTELKKEARNLRIRTQLHWGFLSAYLSFLPVSVFILFSYLRLHILAIPMLKTLLLFPEVIPREGFIWPYLVTGPLLDSSYAQRSGLG